LFHNLLEYKKQKEKEVLVLQQEQNETLKKLITVQDNERKRIAGDLHDNIGPLLAALKINFRRIIQSKESGVQNILAAKTEAIIDDSIAEIRNVAHNLMPKGLSSNGLINTLTDYFDGIQQLYNKPVVFRHHIESVLGPDLQINVYRIICELVLNAARHSNAGVITVQIKADKNCVCCSINDDGKGFEPAAVGSPASFGLQNTESRVLYLKGKYNLTTQQGKGTLISMEIPLQLYQSQVNGF
jgi:two-component system, NarL family, sensor kinase